MGGKSKRDLVLNWLRQKEDHIIFIQESHSTSKAEDDWTKTWEGKIIFNHGQSNSTGVAILIKKDIVEEVKILNQVNIVPGRAMFVEIDYFGTIFGLVNIYCPNKDDTDFLNKVFLEACSISNSENLILGGDWNTILDNDLDKAGGAPSHSNIKCQKLLNGIMADWGLSDIFRLKNPNARIYSHFDHQHKTHTRLDFFLIDDKMVNLPVCTSKITHGFSSDHSYISLTLQGNSIEHGRGYWKFNNSHLYAEEFTNEVRNVIHECQTGSFDSYRGLWDTIKFRVKDSAIRFGKKRRKYKLAEKCLIAKKIKEIKDNPNYLNDVAEMENLLELERRLDDIIKHELDGVIIRSKAQWVEKGERCTKYFFGLEKSRWKKKVINKLQDEVSGDSYVIQEKISNFAVKYYQNLYSTTHSDAANLSDYITNCSLNKIPQSLASTLDEPINIEDFEIVIGGLKKNKSPGWDGLTAEFYKFFWNDIKHILFQSYIESINNNCLSPSQRTGVVTLIPKPKPPPDLVYLTNWRAITLLNVDYKIFTHIVKNKFVKALPHLISKAQTGFQAGKSTTDNLILMSLVIDHFDKKYEDSCLLLQVDFEKAFDTVSHAFLFKILEHMGFGSYLINLVKIAFHGCFSYLNINGYLSAPVYLGRGLHQGSPLSPILFLLVAQAFTNKLHMNEIVRGVHINGIDILSSLYADDTDLFLEATGTCVDEVVRILREFGLVSGCNANWDKTH